MGECACIMRPLAAQTMSLVTPRWCKLTLRASTRFRRLGCLHDVYLANKRSRYRICMQASFCQGFAVRCEVDVPICIVVSAWFQRVSKLSGQTVAVFSFQIHRLTRSKLNSGGYEWKMYEPYEFGSSTTAHSRVVET